MSFWSSETIRERVKSEVLVTPFSPDNVKNCAYELMLGSEYYSTGNGVKVKKRLHKGEQITIPPGQFALLLTREHVKIPDNAIGLISIKAGIKFKGLVNVSGFHVDPGYNGRILFSVYNAGNQDIPLTQEKVYFLLWFCDLDHKTDDLYDGGKVDISDSHVNAIQGNVASPAQLHSRLELLEKQVKTWKWVGATLFGAVISILAALISGVALKLLSNS